MVDQKTAYLKLPLPHMDNTIDEDCPRLRGTLTQLDGHAEQTDQALHQHDAALSTLSEQTALMGRRQDSLERQTEQNKKDIAANVPRTATPDRLGMVQIGPHLEVTPEGVVDAPLASESKQGIGRSATTAEVKSGVTGENGPAWVTPENLALAFSFIEDWRKSWIGVPRFWRSTTLPPNHAWPDGSFVPFADWPEFKAVYDAGGFAGMLMPWDADSATQAANLGKFRPNAANPTGLYIPLHGGQFFRNWTLGQSEDAGAWGRDEIRNLVGSLAPWSAEANASGVFSTGDTRTSRPNGTGTLGSGNTLYSFNASDVVPTGPQNVPQHAWQPVILYLGRPK